MESYILDIFYNDFINEVITGKIDCYFKFNVMFYIYIKEDDEFILPNNDSLKGIIKPILIINDKEKFNKLLVKYINIAMNYYNNDDYIQDLKGIENELYYKIKMIMTLLWSNATIDDFNEPEKYIQRRINHLNNIFEEETISLGYSEIMDTDIYVKFKRERIVNETPNSIVFKCIKDDEEYIYIFPTIRFGISGNVVYIYAIQNDKNNDINLMSKRIKRKMYKVNESTNDLKQNLLDITSSFVIAGDLFIWLMEKLGYKKFSVVGYLPIRWNAKKINNIKKDINGLTQEEQHMFYNATEKFMNTFKRISYHNADLCSYHIFTGLMVDIVSETEQTNNKLLSEMISLSKRYKSD